MELDRYGTWARRLADHCAAEGIVLTELRRQVLELLCQAHGPKRAYDLIDELGRQRGRRISPPTIYRSLNYLVESRLVVRIESRNAYAVREMPGAPAGSTLYVCSSCGSIAEADIPALDHCLNDEAASLGFSVKRRILELEGICRGCVVSDASVDAEIRAYEVSV